MAAQRAASRSSSSIDTGRSLEASSSIASARWSDATGYESPLTDLTDQSTDEDDVPLTQKRRRSKADTMSRSANPPATKRTRRSSSSKPVPASQAFSPRRAPSKAIVKRVAIGITSKNAASASLGWSSTDKYAKEVGRMVAQNPHERMLRNHSSSVPPIGAEKSKLKASWADIKSKQKPSALPKRTAPFTFPPPHSAPKRPASQPVIRQKSTAHPETAAVAPGIDRDKLTNEVNQLIAEHPDERHLRKRSAPPVEPTIAQPKPKRSKLVVASPTEAPAESTQPKPKPKSKLKEEERSAAVFLPVLQAKSSGAGQLGEERYGRRKGRVPKPTKEATPFTAPSIDSGGVSSSPPAAAFTAIVRPDAESSALPAHAFASIATSESGIANGAPRVKKAKGKAKAIQVQSGDDGGGESFLLPPLPASRLAPSRSSSSADLRPVEIDRDSWVTPDQLSILHLEAGNRAPIWSETRQELCESLDYFKAYQGGHSTRDGLNRGYLLSCFGAPRDVFSDGGRVVISHGGGGSAEQASEGDESTPVLAAPKTRNFGLAKSQTRDNFRIKALANNIEYRVPVVLIADAQYVNTPFVAQLGARYVVLGFYYVTHCWAEAEESSNEMHVRLKFRFEWVPSQGRPWWSDLLLPTEVPRTSKSVPAQLSPTLAKLLNPSGQEPVDRDQDPFASRPVLPAGLNTQRAWPALNVECDLKADPRGISTSYCAACDTHSPRIYCEGSICFNELCELFFMAPLPAVGSFGSILARPTTLTYEPDFLHAMRVGVVNERVPTRLFPQSIADLRGSNEPLRYDRSCWRGWHCRQCGRLSSREQWATVTCTYCGDTFRPERRLFTGLDLRNPTDPPPPQYNDGIVSSQRVVGTWQVATFILPVDDGLVHLISPKADSPSLASVAAIFAGYQDPEAGVPFRRNELKAHKLGSRMLAQSFAFNAGEPYKFSVKTQTVPFSESPRAVLDALALLTETSEQIVPDMATGFNEILSLAYMEGQKIAFHDDGETDVGPVVATLSLGSDAVMDFRRKRSKRTGPQPKATGRMGRVCLRMTLRHGDVVIMQGADVQRVYEHAVTPEGYRIAATARCITSS